MSYEQKAKSGAEFFDKNMPGWYRGIDKGKLDIESDQLCIGGQTCGSFGQALLKFGLDDTRAEELGMNINYLFAYDNYQDEFQRLNEAWIGEIDKRLRFDAEVASLLVGELVTS